MTATAFAGASPHALRLRRLPPARPMPVETRAGKFFPVAFDGHVHTWHSRDAVEDPLAVTALARRLGLDALVFTDHGSTRASGDARAGHAAVPTAPGQEIGGLFGHALLWNTPASKPVNPLTTTLSQRAAFAHAHGGMIVLAHPGWWIHGNSHDPAEWMEPQALRRGGLSADLDAIEIWNGTYDTPTRQLVDAWARLLDQGIFVPVVGDSDFHDRRAQRLAHPHNVALCTMPALPCVFDAIKHGRSYVTDGPALSFQANDALPGDIVRGRPGQPLKVTLEAVAPTGGTAVLFLGQSVAARVPLAPGNDARREVTLAMPAADGYLRVEILREVAGRRRPILLLLSNPILLDPDPPRAAWR